MAASELRVWDFDDRRVCQRAVIERNLHARRELQVSKTRRRLDYADRAEDHINVYV